MVKNTQHVELNTRPGKIYSGAVIQTVSSEDSSVTLTYILPFLVIQVLYIIQIYSGITSGRVLEGKLLYTKILEVNP